MRKLVIFMTGQFRSFWKAYSNMMKNIVQPAEDCGYTVILCVGIDSVMKTRGVKWTVEDRKKESEIIGNTWLAERGGKNRGFIMEWIDKTHSDFKMAETSLEWFHNKGSLPTYWKDYLLERSGSCIEYVQFNALMTRCEKEFEFLPEDLLLRTRTDILLRYKMDFQEVYTKTPPPHICSVFHEIPEENKMKIDWKRTGEREASIEQPLIEGDTDHAEEIKWIITFRKNLIYMIPLRYASTICNVARYYGNWDTPQENRYWFNAESQFRGCLRTHGFNVLEYSQDVDECHDEDEFGESAHRLPIYAIMRAI